MGAGRVDVEIAEGPDRGGLAPEEPTRARRGRVLRVLRRWWPVPVVVVAALVGWHALGESRAEAAATRLRTVDGVLERTVAPPLEARPWPVPRAPFVLASALRAQGGTLVLPVPAQDGAWDLVAYDAAAGTETWRARVVDPPGGDLTSDVSCVGDADPAAVLACTATTGRVDETGLWSDAHARLLRVDPRTRSVQDVRDLPPGSAAVIADGAVVLVEQDGGTLVVTATDLGTGALRPWRVDLPDPLVAGTGTQPWVDVVGGHVWVAGGRLTWSLDPATGELEGSGTSLVLTRGDRVVDIAGSSGSRVLGPAGSVVETEGTPERVAPDDGSAPDLLLLRRRDGSGPEGVLRAVDATSGALAWERPLPVEVGSTLVLLDGVLYGAAGDTVWAVDVATGAPRWTTTGERGVGAPLLTDGRALLRTERDPASAEPLLAAYDLAGGRRLWVAPLPARVEAVRGDDGVLRGSGTDLVVTLG